MRRFPIRRSRWALPFLVLLAPRRPYAEVGEGIVAVRMGLLGKADIPVEQVAAIGTVAWPWYAGVGARIARGLVAFVGASGRLALIELTGTVRVRAPLGWDASSIAVGAEDVEGFMAAVAQERRAAGGPKERPGS